MSDVAGQTVTVDPRVMTPEQARDASVAAFRHRFHYRFELAITGRVRFLSHLETVDTLLGALRRCGVKLALSPGMRPKPRIKMAMPRPVATEAWSDIVEVELQEEIEADAFALRLSEVLPAGLVLQRMIRLEGAYASAASRVSGATWRWTLVATDHDPDDIRVAVTRLLASGEALVERSSPNKRTRHVDVRRFIGDMSVVDAGEGPALRAFVRLTDEGSAKPEEVIRALGAVMGRMPHVIRTVRESIAIAEPEGGRVAEPALVGADVPDGPARPWGAC